MINVLELAPYATFVVAHSTIANPVYKNFQNIIKEKLHKKGLSLSALALPTLPNSCAQFAWHITEKRKVRWAGKNVIEDKLNHLLACFGSGEFSLIYASDSEIKNEIQDELFAGNLPNWEPVDHRILVDAYVKGESLKALWLSGAHRDVSFRPTSKILSGRHLQDAIEPFGDSTFIAGAVRTSNCGISLKRSGIWFGPTSDWADFHSCAARVLADLNPRQLTVSSLSSSIHHGLAEALPDFESVSDVYAVQWADIETISGKTRGRKLEELKGLYEIGIVGKQILPPRPPEQIDLSITVKATAASYSVSLVPTTVLGGRVTFKLVAPASTPQSIASCVREILVDATLLKVFYETGHTIADAILSIALIQDRAFKLTYCDFAPLPGIYDITQEKPPGNAFLVSSIFSAVDKSLFQWVFRHGLQQLGLAQPLANTCWLYCDDGSGEVADFIHLDLTPTQTNKAPCITLIHVKGAHNAGTNRRVAVGPYEIVTAQAMKNLRRMIAGEMVGEISKSVATHNDLRVWDTPWALNLVSTPGTGSKMVAALKTVTADCEYQVIIVQPHVQKSVYDANPKSTAGMQLRSLLFGADALTHAAGAKFRVVCDQS